MENQTTEDILALSSRISDDLINCMHIILNNQQVHDFNKQKLKDFSDTATVTVQSCHHLKGGLHIILRLAVEARVSIVRNLYISEGPSALGRHSLEKWKSSLGR